MSNLRFTDTDLDNMENHPNARAMRIGRATPYHLAYARAYRGNEILNSHLPGIRRVAADDKEEEKRDKYRMGEP